MLYQPVVLLYSIPFSCDGVNNKGIIKILPAGAKVTQHHPAPAFAEVQVWAVLRIAVS